MVSVILWLFVFIYVVSVIGGWALLYFNDFDDASSRGQVIVFALTTIVPIVNTVFLLGCLPDVISDWYVKSRLKQWLDAPYRSKRP